MEPQQLKPRNPRNDRYLQNPNAETAFIPQHSPKHPLHGSKLMKPRPSPAESAVIVQVEESSEASETESISEEDTQMAVESTFDDDDEVILILQAQSKLKKEFSSHVARYAAVLGTDVVRSLCLEGLKKKRPSSDATNSDPNKRRKKTTSK